MHPPRVSVITPWASGDPTDVDPKAIELWDALARARAHYNPRVLAEAEDRVFRFYLPLAWTAADAWVAGVARPGDAKRAAEVGLAEAVLRWERGGGAGFEAHARAVIIAQLRWVSTAGAAGAAVTNRLTGRPLAPSSA